MPRQTLTTLRRLKEAGEKICMLTAYDASFARVVDDAGVECILIGDSLGNVIQGRDSTLPVTLDHAVYHTECVVRGAPQSFIVADLPFGSYQVSPEQAYASAARLMAAGAHMVKLEGGMPMLKTVRFLSQRGIPVCGHLGLTPQSVHALGGFRVQGQQPDARALMLEEAKRLEQAGADMIVFEMIPASLAAEITAAADAITIGIGAGPDCHGQVLVLYDMLDVVPGRKARFVRNFMAEGGSIRDAIDRYVRDVKAGKFPAPEHSFR